MAVGDAAAQQNYPLVPDTGEDGKVKWGARELNRTRDFIANLKAGQPVGRGGYRTAAGITNGTSDPSPTYGLDGDIYLKVLS